MRPKLTTSGYLIPRAAAALICLSVATFLGFFSFAATPSSGTITDTSGPLQYKSGPFLQSNPTGFAGEVECSLETPCDDFALTVTVPAGFENTHNLIITTEWPNAAEDFDIYLLRDAMRRV